MQNHKKKIVIYGGNGFVGTRVAKQLAERDACAVCLSRTGHKPLHLKDHKWSESVRWCKGDASAADQKLLSSIDALVILVGSPPLPTFSKESYEKQLFMNGTTAVKAIESASQAGVKRVVLVGAKLPWLIRSKRFAYAKGKAMGLDAAQKFAEASDENTAVVLQPGVIYGKRHLVSGKVIPLDSLCAPLSKLMPWQFVSVEKVAQRIAAAVLDDEPYLGKFTVIKHNNI